MQINYVYDQNVATLPAGFVSVMNYAASYFNTLFKANITITLQVGYGSITQNGTTTPITTGGNALGGPNNLTPIAYSALAAALRTTGNSAALRAELANLPAADPTGGAGVLLTDPQRKALGLIAGNAPGVDGSIGFAADGLGGVTYNYSTTLAGRNSGTGADLLSTVMHEIAHAIGRLDGQGTSWNLFDLTRYASAGTFAARGRVPAYFSLDGGRTNLRNYDTTSDTSDWAAGQGPDSFNAAGAGGADPITGVDRQLMNAIGFNSAYAARDFFGARTSSVLWFNTASGTVLNWGMSNGALSTSTTIAGFATNSGWSLAGTADLTGDGVSDVLLSNASGGQTTIGTWIVANGAFSSYRTIGGFAANSGWALVGTGDFTGDGVADILLSFTSGGNVSLFDWEISNGAIAATNNLNMGYSVASGWRAIGTGDFNGDGFSDVLFQNAQSGLVADWQLNPVTGAAGGFVPIAGVAPNTGWTFDGVGDFNGDGTSDILWQNGATLAIWSVQNGALAQPVSLNAAAMVNNGNVFAGIGDYNGDGTSDILWRHSTSGTVTDWLMGGNALQQSVQAGGADPASWRIVA